jgi:hypothetical protein
MVARHTPGLLDYWDECASTIGICAKVFLKTQHPGAELALEAHIERPLAALLTIMEQPEAAKRGLEASLVPRYEITRDILRRLRDLRRRQRSVTYAPAAPPWAGHPIGDLLRRTRFDPDAEGRPPVTVRTDSPDLYREALREVYGPPKEPPETVVAECHSLWEEPAQAAFVVLEDLTGRDRSYLPKLVSTLRGRHFRKPNLRS